MTLHFREGIVYIDDREPPSVKKQLSSYFNTRQIPTRITRMEIGDIYYNKILIERKDCVDFIASWKDKRLQNQRYNMLLEQKKKSAHAYVVIQGTYSEAEKDLNHVQLDAGGISRWLGTIASLNEIGISTIQLEHRNNHNHLAQVVDSLAKHRNEDKEIHEVFLEPQGMSWDMKAYQCIHGIGYTIAKSLAETISIRDLLRRPEGNAIEILSTVEGIGKKKAKNIYQTIHKHEKLTPYNEL